jgi:surface antigen
MAVIMASVWASGGCTPMDDINIQADQTGKVQDGAGEPLEGNPGTEPDRSVGGDLTVGATVEVANTGGTTLRCRAAPGTGEDIVVRLAEGYQVTVRDGPRPSGGYDWWLVETANGTDCWVADDWLSPVDSGSGEPDGDQNEDVLTEDDFDSYYTVQDNGDPRLADSTTDSPPLPGWFRELFNIEVRAAEDDEQYSREQWDSVIDYRFIWVPDGWIILPNERDLSLGTTIELPAGQRIYDEHDVESGSFGTPRSWMYTVANGPVSVEGAADRNWWYVTKEGIRQCTWLAARVYPEVLNLLPLSGANAKVWDEYLNDSSGQFRSVEEPEQGDIFVIEGRNVNGYFGHVGYVWEVDHENGTFTPCEANLHLQGQIGVRGYGIKYPQDDVSFIRPPVVRRPENCTLEGVMAVFDQAVPGEPVQEPEEEQPIEPADRSLWDKLKGIPADVSTWVEDAGAWFESLPQKVDEQMTKWRDRFEQWLAEQAQKLEREAEKAFWQWIEDMCLAGAAVLILPALGLIVQQTRNGAGRKHR